MPKKSGKKGSVKSVAQIYWKQFEDLSFELIKDMYKLKPDMHSRITRRVHDGGYDGMIWFPNRTHESGELYKILLEAKLRTNHKQALPLSDFSKTIIVAVNTISHRVYISTNAFFSSETIKKLQNFSQRTGLEIRTINLKDITAWLKENPHWAKGKHEERLAAELHNMAALTDMSLWPVLPEEDEIAIEHPIIGMERRRQREAANQLLVASPGILICKGPAGAGKSTFLHNVINHLNGHSFYTKVLNLQLYDTSREIFISFLSLIWGVDFVQICTMSQEELQELTNHLGDEAFPENQQRTLISMIQLPQDDFNKNSELNNTLLIEYLYKIFSPILGRVHYYIIIENAHEATAAALQFLLRVIKRLIGCRISFLVEETEPFSQTKKLSKPEWDSFLYELRRTNVYLDTVTLNIWDQDACMEFIRFCEPEFPDEKATQVIGYFGGVPLFLQAGLTLFKNKPSYSYWLSTPSHNLIEQELVSIGYIEEAIYEHALLCGETVCKLFVLLALFDGELARPILEKFFSSEEISSMKRKLYNSIFVHFGDAAVKVQHGAYLKSFKRFRYVSSEFLYQIVIEADNYIVSRIDVIPKPDIWSKRFLYAKIINEPKHVLSFWWDYVNCLRSLGEENLVLEVLICVYEWSNRALLSLTPDERYRLLAKLTEIKIHIGQGHSAEVPSYMNEMEALIKLSNGTPMETAFKMSRLLHAKCSIALSSGDYVSLEAFSGEGMSLERIQSHLLREFYVFHALAIKHLKQLEACLAFLDEHLTEMKADVHYKCFYNSHKAGLYTGSDPQKALEYFEENRALREEASLEISLHNEHNIATMHFMLGHYEKATEFCRQTWLNAYRCNDRVEEGRSSHLMGCIYWVHESRELAYEQFKSAYTLFKDIVHMTHIWPSAVNLATLCFEMGPEYLPEGLFYTDCAVDLILDVHLSQINSLQLHVGNLPKIYAAILILTNHYQTHDAESDRLARMRKEITLSSFKQDYRVVCQGGILDILRDTTYCHKGHLMLKV